MTVRADVMGLIEELAKLARERGASRIEVETEDFAVSVGVGASAPAPAAAQPPGPVIGAKSPAPAPPDTARVTASAVGIFSAAREWGPGETVQSGTVLGAIQSLGHMAEVTAPSDGRISEVLVAGGAPVEYGQPLFVIARS